MILLESSTTPLCERCAYQYVRVKYTETMRILSSLKPVPNRLNDEA